MKHLLNPNPSRTKTGMISHRYFKVAFLEEIYKLFAVLRWIEEIGLMMSCERK